MKVLLVVCSLVGLFVPGVRADYISEVLADDPIAWYRFEESSGLTAFDSSVSGANHDAVYAGTVTPGASGPTLALGNAADFTPQAAVRITDHADFDLGTGDFSLELWFKADVGTRGDLFTYKGTGGDFGLHSSGAGGSNTVQVFHGGFVSDQAGVAVGSWHHFVLSRASGMSSVYVDGALRETVAHGNTLNITNDLLIGSNHTGDPAARAIGFTGQIDEVAFYNTALDVSRVEAHFAAAIPEPSTLSMLGLGLLLVLRRFSWN